MSAEPFDVLQQATDALEAGKPDRAAAAALIVLATEAARCREQLMLIRSELDYIGDRLSIVAVTLDDPEARKP